VRPAKERHGPGRPSRWKLFLAVADLGAHAPLFAADLTTSLASLLSTHTGLRIAVAFQNLRGGKPRIVAQQNRDSQVAFSLARWPKSCLRCRLKQGRLPPAEPREGDAVGTASRARAADPRFKGHVFWVVCCNCLSSLYNHTNSGGWLVRGREVPELKSRDRRMPKATSGRQISRERLEFWTVLGLLGGPENF
jgi:hypothetical protein